ncbi:Beta-porphyranase A precursor [Rubripirellula amarantea]|uniref:Beta-porphyranase A n=1 Tax=Rubripirellula amarantea TaxID=2527999 RepID=A0A5C5WJL4_9BACT|nr:family 16 glycosylhydrolase [Rubripirellula amarantea]TWT50757.1 Beta-porphyranase A precursor [Rubripirellula amarantea]
MRNQLLRILCVVGLIVTGLDSLALAQPPFSDPDNQGEWELLSLVSDEFNGAEIDSDKWFVQGTNGEYANRFKGRAPSQFVPANVQVADGHLVITSRWQPEYEFADEVFGGFPYANITSGAIISKHSFLYGYLETRCKAAEGPISSSFWSIGESGELDVFEHYGHNPDSTDASHRLQSSFHDWRVPGSPTYGKRIWTNEHQLPFKVASDFHVYGMEWGPNQVKIFVDGILVRCASKEEIGDKWVVDHDQKVWLDSETFPWEVDPAKLKPSDFPNSGQEFSVDYVRVWQSNKQTEGCWKQDNLLTNPIFDHNLDGWNVSGDVVLKEERAESWAGSSHVSLAANREGAIEQTVAVKPNTTYIVSAYAKAPATNYQDVYHDAWLGVKNYDGDFQTVRFFQNYWHRKSIQFKTGPNAKTATVFFTNQWSAEPVLVDSFELIEATAKR